MKPTHDRDWIDVQTARYLDALERDDQVTLSEIWGLAHAEPDLIKALEELHEGLLEESQLDSDESIQTLMTTAVNTFLPSAEIVRSGTGPVTVGEVADELFRHAPDRLSAAAHVLNEQLRNSREPLPTELGLSKLTAWGDTKFGSVPPEYWKAFRQAAVKLELRRAADVEYRLAARRNSGKENRP